MALVARDLGHTYGAATRAPVPALAGVDLALERGSLLVVAGATGSGKSTLLRLLAGLLPPTRGTVSVDGVAVDSRAARGLVALVFQNPEAQFFGETVLADVAFGPRNLGMRDPHAAARAALELVGIDPVDFGDRSPFVLSGGEARRVAIAGILAMGSPYLLLDEPTAGLDAVGRASVISAIGRQRESAGVVVVTHDPAELLHLADRVLILDGGVPVADVPSPRSPADYRDLEAAGLALPEFVRTQLLAARHGIILDVVLADPDALADLLVAGRGGPA